MNYIKSILLSAAVALGAAGCDMGDFGDINVNPNKPSVAPTSSLFVGSARYVRTFVMTSSSYDP